MRIAIWLLLMLSLIGGGVSCRSVEGDVEQVGGSPLLTSEAVAAVSADAVVHVCVTCVAGTVYVRAQLLTGKTLIGEEQPMPEDTKREPEDGTVISVGPVEELTPGVIGVEVGTITAGDGFRAQIVQFQWDGDGWKLATDEDTGVTVTTAVS